MKAIELLFTVGLIVIGAVIFSYFGVTALSSTGSSLETIIDFADVFKSTFDSIDCVASCYTTLTENERVGTYTASGVKNSYSLIEYFPCNQKFLTIASIILETATKIKETMQSETPVTITGTDLTPAIGKCNYLLNPTTTEYEITIVTPIEIVYYSLYNLRIANWNPATGKKSLYTYLSQLISRYGIDYPSPSFFYHYGDYCPSGEQCIDPTKMTEYTFSKDTIMLDDFLDEQVEYLLGLTDNFYNFTFGVVNEEVCRASEIGTSNACSIANQFGSDTSLNLITIKFTGVGRNESSCENGWTKIVPYGNRLPYCIRDKCLGKDFESSLLLSCLEGNSVEVFEGYPLTCDSFNLTKNGFLIKPDLSTQPDNIFIFDYSTKSFTPNAQECERFSLSPCTDVIIKLSPEYEKIGCNLATDDKLPSHFEGLEGIDAGLGVGNGLPEGKCYAVALPTFNDYCREYTRLGLYGYFPCGSRQNAVNIVKEMLDVELEYLERDNYDVLNNFVCSATPAVGTKENPIKLVSSPVYLKDEYGGYGVFPRTFYSTEQKFDLSYIFSPELISECSPVILSYEFEVDGEAELGQSLEVSFSDGINQNTLELSQDNPILNLNKFDIFPQNGIYDISVKIKEDGTESEAYINTPAGESAMPISKSQSNYEFKYLQNFYTGGDLVIKGLSLYLADSTPNIESQDKPPLFIRVLDSNGNSLVEKDIPAAYIYDEPEWVDIFFNQEQWIYTLAGEKYTIELSCQDCEFGSGYYIYRSSIGVSYIDGFEFTFTTDNCGEYPHCNLISYTCIGGGTEPYKSYTCNEDISFKVYIPAKTYTINSANLNFIYYCNIIERSAKYAVDKAPYDLCSDEPQKYNTTICRPAWTTMIEQKGTCEDFSLMQYSLMRSINIPESSLTMETGYCDMPCECKNLFDLCDIDYELTGCKTYSQTKYGEKVIYNGCANSEISDYGFSYDVDLGSKVSQININSAQLFKEIRTSPNIVSQKVYYPLSYIYCSTNNCDYEPFEEIIVSSLGDPCNVNFYCNIQNEFTAVPCFGDYTLLSNNNGVLDSGDKCVFSEEVIDIFCSENEIFCEASPFYNSYCIPNTESCITANENEKTFLFESAEKVYLKEESSDIEEGYYRVRCETAPESVSRLTPMCTSVSSMSASDRDLLINKCNAKESICSDMCFSYSGKPFSMCSEINQNECGNLEVCDVDNDGKWTSADGTFGHTDDKPFVAQYCSYCAGYPCNLQDFSGNSCPLKCAQ
ncbi:MAG: hypothetical protein PHW96_04415 [Candidatus Nanoarchaeia archaeon]|nr:hypothetical protein [Candidatus Nanoarchaeia archaeon]